VYAVEPSISVMRTVVTSGTLPPLRLWWSSVLIENRISIHMQASARGFGE
jgi:hypothetical protein